MLRLLSAVAVVALLSAPSVHAQSDSNNQSGGQSSGQSGGGQSGSGQASGGQSGGGQMFIAEQTSEQFRASNLLDRPILTTNDQELGSIDDLLFDKNNELTAVVVGVGGFLGIGDKLVAIDWKAINQKRDNTGNIVLTVDTTEEQIDQAPDFTPIEVKQAAQDNQQSGGGSGGESGGGSGGESGGGSGGESGGGSGGESGGSGSN